MVEAHKRAYRDPKYKTSYRIKNWPEYEKSLRTEAASRSILISPSSGRIPQIFPKTDGSASALSKSYDSIPPESNGKCLQMPRELVGRPFNHDCGQFGFEDLQPGRMAIQEAWKKDP